MGSFIKLFLLFVLFFHLVEAQTPWKKHPRNPVVSASREITWAYSASVLFDENSGVYRMWYSALLRSTPFLQVMYAISYDGVGWHQNLVDPVLESGAFGEFDYGGISDPCVIYTDGEYKMYYTGQAGNSWQTGLATSQDGIQWTKHPSNPVIGIGTGWESVGHGSVEVVKASGIYKMLYSGFDGSKHMIGLATSSDGISWSRHPSNPVFRPSTGGSWDSFSIFASAQIIKDGIHYLFYVGKPTNGIGLAISSDAVTWERARPTPVLSPGGAGTWESQVLTGSMLLRDGQTQFWYTGQSSSFQIGFAYSELDYLLNAEHPGEKKKQDLALGNYPNPFNPSTRIWFILPRDEHVKITLFNSLGQTVAKLFDGVETAGYHELEWSPIASASGVYYYKVSTHDKEEIRSMLLMR